MADVDNPASEDASELALNAWDLLHRAASRVGRGRRAVVFWVVCFGCGGISFLCSLFLLGTHMAYCEYEVALPHLPVYYCSS